MDKELISIIIPVYKVEQYIDKCVESVVGQTYKNLEIILVDDGSPDNCGKMCDAWAEKDKRIRVIHKENGGLSSARNAGIDASTGEYLMFIDSDDYIAPEMAEKLYKALNENDADVSECGIIRINEDNTPDRLDIPSICIGRQYALECVLTGRYLLTFVVNKLFRSKLFQTVRFPEGKFFEDKFISHRIIGQCNSVCLISDMLYYWAIRKDSITQTAGWVHRLNWLQALGDGISYCNPSSSTTLFSEIFYNYATRLSALYDDQISVDRYSLDMRVLRSLVLRFFYLRKQCTIRQKIHLWIIRISPKFHHILVKLFG